MCELARFPNDGSMNKECGSYLVSLHRPVARNFSGGVRFLWMTFFFRKEKFFLNDVFFRKEKTFSFFLNDFFFRKEKSGPFFSVGGANAPLAPPLATGLLHRCRGLYIGFSLAPEGSITPFILLLCDSRKKAICQISLKKECHGYKSFQV